MDLRLTIHFRRRPDGSHLATAVMVSGRVVRFYRAALAPDVDPYRAYAEVAAAAVRYLADHAGQEPKPADRAKPAGRVVQFQGVLPT